MADHPHPTCKRGHPLKPPNLILYDENTRQECRLCGPLSLYPFPQFGPIIGYMKTSTALSAFAVLLLAAVSSFGQGAPDCAWTDTFGAAVAGTSHNNTSSGNSPCVAYRVTYDAVGMTAISLQLEGAPWNSGGTGPGTFAAITGSAIVQGTNPLTSATNATLATTGTVYYPFVRIHVTTFTPTGSSGTITVRTYGYKGTSAAVPAAGGGGTITGGPFVLGHIIEGGGGQAIADSGISLAGLLPIHSIGATFYGAQAVSGSVFCCLVAANASTTGMIGWDIVVDDGTGSGTCASCTCTVKFWRVATGTTTPTSAASLNTSGVSLSTGTSVSSATLTDFSSTAIAAGDRFAVDLSAAASIPSIGTVFAELRYQ
jgi:hypothetical protein